jgi:hypothetical protein
LSDHLEWSPKKLKAAAICPPKAQPVCGSVHAVNVMAMLLLFVFGDKQVVCQQLISARPKTVIFPNLCVRLKL